jgi:hypothetical protein
MHLTYRDPLAHTGVVSAESAEAGAPVIEVTPAMIAAGMDALTSRYQDLVWPELDLYPEILCTVYRAMVASRN